MIAAIQGQRTIWRVQTIEQAVQRLGLIGKSRQQAVLALKLCKEHAHNGVLLVAL